MSIKSCLNSPVRPFQILCLRQATSRGTREMFSIWPKSRRSFSLDALFARSLALTCTRKITLGSFRQRL